MRPVSLPHATSMEQVRANFRELEQASHMERVVSIAQAFTVTNVTETRTLDASTATVTDVANFLGTLIQDMRNGGKFSQ